MATKILTLQQINDFVAALNETLVAAERGLQLQRLVSGFNGAAAARPLPSVTTRTPSAKRTAPSKRSTRSRKPGLATGKVLEGLKGAKDGLSLGALAAKLGEKNKVRVAAALRKLRDEKKAVVKGDRRYARWFAA